MRRSKSSGDQSNIRCFLSSPLLSVYKNSWLMVNYRRSTIQVRSKYILKSLFLIFQLMIMQISIANLPLVPSKVQLHSMIKMTVILNGPVFHSMTFNTKLPLSQSILKVYSIQITRTLAVKCWNHSKLLVEQFWVKILKKLNASAMLMVIWKAISRNQVESLIVWMTFSRIWLLINLNLKFNRGKSKNRICWRTMK